jgi:hypothetical protein
MQRDRECRAELGLNDAAAEAPLMDVICRAPIKVDNRAIFAAPGACSTR